MAVSAFRLALSRRPCKPAPVCGWLEPKGVYIMPEGGEPLIIYSEQCHPKGDIDWW